MYFLKGNGRRSFSRYKKTNWITKTALGDYVGFHRNTIRSDIKKGLVDLKDIFSIFDYVRYTRADAQKLWITPKKNQKNKSQ